MRTPKQLLDDILAQIIAIETFLSSSQIPLEQDIKMQYAIMMAYCIIGEATKNLPSDTLSQYENEWKQIKGFRDYLVHNYHQVYVERIQEALKKLPILRATIEKMLDDLQKDEDEKSHE